MFFLKFIYLAILLLVIYFCLCIMYVVGTLGKHNKNSIFSFEGIYQLNYKIKDSESLDDEFNYIYCIQRYVSKNKKFFHYFL